jgi:hypothetical protein
MTVLHVLGVIGGLAIVAGVLVSALRTVVLPQGGLTRITAIVFAGAHRVFIRRGPKVEGHHPVTHVYDARRSFTQRSRPLFAPAALVTLPFVWSMVVTLGFTLVFWGFGEGNLSDSFVTSGSSLFTLGFVKPSTNWMVLVAFVEATIGLGLVALMIGYLPTIYTVYSQREKGVALLRPLIGSPPHPVQFIRRLHFGGSIETATVWPGASSWFTELAQSHGAFPALTSFPSQTDLWWVRTAATMLDSAALLLSLTKRASHGELGPGPDGARGTELVLLLAHGMPALAQIAEAANLPVSVRHLDLVDLPELVHRDPPPITITRDAYDQARAQLAAVGLPVDTDPEVGWRAFAWIRSAYDQSVTALAGYTDTPGGCWSIEQPAHVGRPRFARHRRIDVVWPAMADEPD